MSRTQGLVSLKIAAEILGCGTSTLRTWDNEGSLKAVRTPGGQRRYRIEDLEKFQTNGAEKVKCPKLTGLPADYRKTCNHCENEFDKSHFHRNALMRDGLQPTCKKCTAESQAAWYKNNSEFARATGIAFRRKNPKKIMLRAARTRAEQKGREFTITEDDFDIPTHCPVFGIPLILGAGSGRSGPTDNSPSLDRLDPLKGYIPGNVWVISGRANRLKDDATLEELELLVLALKRKKAEKAAVAP